MARTKEERYGGALLRIMPLGDTFRGVVIRDGRQGDIIEDSDEQRLWTRLRTDAGKQHPDYVGYDGAIARFRQFFPNGFSDGRYIAKERQYKLEAREKLLTAAPLEQVLAGADFDIKGVAKAFQTNMLSTFEAARVSELLRGANGSRFVLAAAKFAAGDLATGLREMSLAVEPHGRASWPIVTYLPFFWQPAEHMFLKPEKTVDFASRVGSPFAHEYAAELEHGTYDALLELAATTEARLAKLEPVDRIDIQSFMWVVGAYQEVDLPTSGADASSASA